MITCEPNALLDDARCLRCIPPGELNKIRTYLLCQLATGVSIENPTDLIAGQSYVGPLHRYTKLGLTNGGLYRIVWGADDLQASNGVTTITNPGPGLASFLIVGNSGSIEFVGAGNVPVTAQLFAV